MEVVGPGIGMQFADVPAGGLFLANDHGKATPCIKAVRGLESASASVWCIVLFPDRPPYPGPRIAMFNNWFEGQSVILLDGAALVMSLENDALAFSHAVAIGEVVLLPERKLMKVASNATSEYLDLCSGQILPQVSEDWPATPWPVCRRWGIRWRAPETVEMAQWVFSGQPREI